MIYLLIVVFILLIVVFGFWAARQQKKRLKQAEEFYALPQIKALLESGFTKDDDAIVGMIHEYPAGLYCWFEVTGPRYFAYLRCKAPPFQRFIPSAINITTANASG